MNSYILVNRMSHQKAYALLYACVVFRLPYRFGMVEKKYLFHFWLIAIPLLKSMKTIYRNVTRNFNVELYKKYQWLTGCEKMCRLFGWSCLLFNKKKSNWNSENKA